MNSIVGRSTVQSVQVQNIECRWKLNKFITYCWCNCKIQALETREKCGCGPLPALDPRSRPTPQKRLQSHHSPDAATGGPPVARASDTGPTGGASSGEPTGTQEQMIVSSSAPPTIAPLGDPSPPASLMKTDTRDSEPLRLFPREKRADDPLVVVNINDSKNG